LCLRYWKGNPLAGAIELFEVEAVALAVNSRRPVWDSLKWLCLLNELDPIETTAALRALASKVKSRPLEEGVHEDVRARVAALLLWLTGDEDDDAQAIALDSSLDRVVRYEDHYLANPGRSLFPSERRHAEMVEKNLEKASN